MVSHTATQLCNIAEKSTISLLDEPIENMIAEDFIIVWLDQYMNEIENQNHVETIKILLQQIHYYTLFFTEPESCIEYLKSATKEKIFLVITCSCAVEYLNKIHPIKQIDSIFIFCLCQEKTTYLKDKYSKIIDVFNQETKLIESLSINVDFVLGQEIVFSLFESKKHSTRYLTREASSFIWFQLLTDILRTITDKENAGIEEMLTYCHSYYRGNQVELKNIEEFRRKYNPEDAITWYCKQTFIYRLVNKALRTEDIDVLYAFRVYITHLRTQLAFEHNKLRTITGTSKTKILRVYRGLKMAYNEIFQICDNSGCLISMNGFFSTSRNIEQAVRFANKSSQRKDVAGVLLEITGNVVFDNMVFADIGKFSTFPKKQEVLFDLATVFKIVHVEFDQGRKLWIMQFTGVDETSCKVNDYIKNLRENSEESNSLLLFSRLMCNMGEYEKSEKYLKNLLLNLPSTDNDISKIYFNLGHVCYLRGEYKQSLEYYEQALNRQKDEVYPKELSLEIARTLHNIGDVHLDQKRITKALEYYEKALIIRRELLCDNPDHSSIAKSLIAIGSIHKRRGNSSEALELFQQSFKMKKLTLEPDYPSLADSFDTLGTIYQEMNVLKKAIKCYKEALNIKKKTLPATHPSISSTLNNMGTVYRKVGNNKKALSCYTQALQIEQAKLLSNNLDLVDIYNNLCSLYYEQSMYKEALEMVELKLKILQKHFNDDDTQIQHTKQDIEQIHEELNQKSNTKEMDNDLVEVYF